MKRIWKYKNGALVEIISHPNPKQETVDTLNRLSGDDWDFYRLIDWPTPADENDWKESNCCWATIRLDICSDCWEHCSPV